MRPRQEQSSGPDSTNFQAGRDVVHHGVTAAEARNIALDVFSANFLKLAGVAESVARDRADRITRDYLDKLERSNPAALTSVQDPDMLNTIYMAQRGFAWSGDEDLEKTLVDLLVDRSGQEDRELKTLALNEAVAVLPKLTISQRKSIAACFVVRYVGYSGPLLLERFYNFFNMSLSQFAEAVSGRLPDYQHIQSVGAGALSAYSITLEDSLSETARGFFTNGFTRGHVPESLREHLDDHDVFIPCLRDRHRLQVNSVGVQNIKLLATAKSIDSNTLEGLSRVGIMSSGQIMSDMESYFPTVRPLFELWRSASLGLNRLELTSAGMAIGHAYWRHAIGDEGAPLDVWLR